MLAKLVQSGGLNAIARQLGEPPAATLAAARTLMPGLLAGLRSYPGGIGTLLSGFAKAGGDRFATEIMGPGPIDSSPGQAIIAKIGGIVVSDGNDTPESQALRVRLAPLLAMLAVGYLFALATTGRLTEADLAEILSDGDKNRPPDDEPV